MIDLSIILYIFLTFSYIVFWAFLDSKNTNHFATPIAGFGAFLIIAATYTIIHLNNSVLEVTTIECYKLGGCMEEKFNLQIIKNYEIENSKSVIDQKINNKEVIK